ncbi:MAG TPA: hypothetical protein VHO50_07660 [Bacteroidales bacterium]|nr:hypothetical protein [Bacteroidales bacterium]
MKINKSNSVLVFLSFLTIILLGFKVGRTGNNYFNFENAASDSVSSLVALSNFWDMYYDYGYDLDILSEHNNQPGKRINSISVYRLSSDAAEETLQDSILLNSEGRPVLKISPHESGPSYTWYYYDAKGRLYLDIMINSNKYDTLYTLRQLDMYNHASKTIEYNITRKELQFLTLIETNTQSDGLVQLNMARFDPDLKYNKVLPFEARDMLISIAGDSLLSVHTNRTVFSDTSYNSTYTDLYRIENNRLVHNKITCQTLYDQHGNWIEKKSNSFNIRRRFSYNDSVEPEITKTLPINASVVEFLSTQMDSLPAIAWKNYEDDQISLKNREMMYEEGSYGDSITLTEANSLGEFLPELWYVVSEVSGNLTGFDSTCYVVGYNTPLSSGDGDNLRCLAIYEQRNGIIRLKKQSFGALDPFYDADEDLVFDAFDETNFSVSLQDGNIVVYYEYMRGEATNEYAFEDGKWVLVYTSSSHRTCCQAEIVSYDYRTKTYSFSLFNMIDEEEYENSDMPHDTSYTEIEDRPVIYMDGPQGSSFNPDETSDEE